MGAIALWVRSVLRRRWGATVVVAMLAGVAAGVVGGSAQAARRADGSVQRYESRNRAYDLVFRGCPPGVDPNQFGLGLSEAIQKCVNVEEMSRLGHEVLEPIPEVEAVSTLSLLVAAVLDDTATNGWGRGVLIFAISSADPVGLLEHQILVDGRFADPSASGEVIIGERAARLGGIRAGDRIRLASWSQDHIDLPSSTGDGPETVPFESRVVGIVRFGEDLQASSAGDLTGALLPDGLYAGPAWMAAHGADFATYGTGAVVRLRNRFDGEAPLLQRLQAGSGGWSLAEPEGLGEVDLPALERVVDSERQAVGLFALIALVAGMVFVGLTVVRQLRRELTDGPALSALGLTRRGLMGATIIRSLVAGLLAAAIGASTVVVFSPLGPVGIARRMEYSHPVRVDWPVLVAVSLAVPMFLGLVAVLAVLVDGRSTKQPGRHATPMSAMPLGTVSRVSLHFARGGSPRLAIAFGAVAVAGSVAAGGIIHSFDRVIDNPVRYGAWWDVAVGQYSDPEELQAGIDRLVANPLVQDAAGFLENSASVRLDDLTVPYIAFEPYVGRPEAVMATGRAPRAADEVALGADTARRLGSAIGDTLTLTSDTLTLTSTEQESFATSVRVTGIVVLNNAVRSASGAGDGVLVQAELARQITFGQLVAQSIVIRFDPTADRKAAIASVVRDFGGSTRLASPQTDLRNFARLRAVPWLIAALVGILALASLVHALVTLLQRRSRDLAVLAALGMTTRQRRSVGIGVGVALVVGSIVIGLPAGLVAGRWVWRVIARRISIPSGPVNAWGEVALAPLSALTVAVAVAAIAARWVTRKSPAAQLRAE